MAPRSGKVLVIGVVLFHSVLIAAYTFPRDLVPERLHGIGQWYARPLFHQSWKLFAPEPPLCSCALEARVAEGTWQRIDGGTENYLQRRSVQSLARYVQVEVHSSDTVPNAILLSAMHANFLQGSKDTGREAGSLRTEFRLVERCIADPLRPAERGIRITQLHQR